MDFSNVSLNEPSLIEEQDGYFDEYDRAMEAARLSADIQDYCYSQHYLWQQKEQVNENDDDDTMMMEYQEEENNYYYYDGDDDMMDEDDRQSIASEEESSYNNEALLSLIAGVQSYLTDATNAGIVKDSPLLELQYKMYLYMKQQACEMGYNVDELCYPC
ncbi:hypothetical protein O0I10_005156 [Lichtheimia ornata]|uniref:Uncharacterized protein n=1 Tax=Lichtheimia ornata TaxID=688661 RepID=A0AAD7V721_9FUNG|nr:uncharacterized protein O0I10_005156 [Lichtheimia ornata]KAJ8659117.1 hypothetical protein O0I10_005156 [Lichtheimia ornata]